MELVERFNHDQLIKLGFAYKSLPEATVGEFEYCKPYYIDFFSGLSLVYVEGVFMLCSQVNRPVTIDIRDLQDLEEFIDMVTMNRPKYLLLSFFKFVKELVK